jgi:methionyl-tRNA formyltransferase
MSLIDLKKNLANNSLKKIMFLGTPDFAEIHLSALIDNGEEVICVVTQPDRPSGRGHKMTSPPVKELALRHDLTVLQPTTKLELESLIKKENPDIVIAVAYGMILTKEIVDNYLCLNVHASLLPKYRGPSPIQAAILSGDNEAGTSIMVLDEKMDTGPVITKEHLIIKNTHNVGMLFDELAKLGSVLLVNTLVMLRGKRDKVEVSYQDDSAATYTKKITKQDALIDFSKPPGIVCRQIKAMNPWPGAYLEKNGLIIKIPDAKLDEQGNLQILSIKPAGKKEMPYSEYLKGNDPIF